MAKSRKKKAKSGKKKTISVRDLPATKGGAAVKGGAANSAKWVRSV